MAKTALRRSREALPSAACRFMRASAASRHRINSRSRPSASAAGKRLPKSCGAPISSLAASACRLPRSRGDMNGLALRHARDRAMGHGPEHMPELAALIQRALVGNEDEAKVAADVTAFRRRFRELRYIRVSQRLPLAPSRDEFSARRSGGARRDSRGASYTRQRWKANDRRVERLCPQRTSPPLRGERRPAQAYSRLPLLRRGKSERLRAGADGGAGRGARGHGMRREPSSRRWRAMTATRSRGNRRSRPCFCRRCASAPCHRAEPKGSAGSPAVSSSAGDALGAPVRRIENVPDIGELGLAVRRHDPR